MSDNTIYVGGGWGRQVDALPPAVRAAQAAEDRRDAEQARERIARRETLQERNLMLAMDAAVQRGELVSIAETHRTRGANIGRTHAEILAYVSVEQDREDAIARRKAEKEIARVGELTYYEQHSADTSAPTRAELAEAEASRATAAQELAQRARTRQRVQDFQAQGRRMHDTARSVLRLRDMGVL